MGINNGTASADTELANLQKVRDLLLDSDRKQTSDRLSRLESELRKEIDRSRTAFEHELKAMGKAFEDRMQALELALTEGEEHQASKLDQLKKSLRGRMDKLDAESKARGKGLRERISAVTHKLREEASEREAVLLDKLKTGLDSAGQRSLSRQEMAELLAELAEQLSSDS